MNKNIIIVFLAVMFLSIAGIGTSSAHSTSISVYHDLEDVDYINVDQGKMLEVGACLYVDEVDLSQWFRILELKVYDNNEKLIYMKNATRVLVRRDGKLTLKTGLVDVTD